MSIYRARAADFGGFLDYNTGKVKYIIGTRGEICTNTLVTARINDPRNAKYVANLKAYGYKSVGNVVADCAGYFEMFLSGGTWQRPLTKWKYPDVSTWGLLAEVKAQGLPAGPISTLPRNCPYPIAVEYSGHVGWFYKGRVYQSAGHAVGTIITDLTDTKYNKVWKTWYMIPWLDYEGWVPGENQDGEEVQDMINILGKGPEVEAIQLALIDLGFGGDMNPDLIGMGGPKTRAALISFQKDSGIPQTGVVDDATQAAIIEALIDRAPDPEAIKDLQAENRELKATIEAVKTALKI
ncbi:MAG: peptidoglycan-binding protein [Oscillospiraceae bacterium]|nr:peptidoglycan-binding protein [Oscillospiraceae bacterium]